MKRTVTGVCVAAAFGCIATLGAQTPTTSTTAGQRAPMADKARDVTVTGCLAKAADGKFTLTNARIENPVGDPSSTTAGTSTTTAGTTTAGTTAGTTANTTTSSEGAMNRAAATAFMLAGGSDLEKHVGHKIQVTGRTEWNNPTDRSRTPETSTSAAGTTAGTVGTTGTTTTAATEDQRKDTRADQPRLDVQSIKMIAPSCS
jgi:hypothetical protein